MDDHRERSRRQESRSADEASQQAERATEQDGYVGAEDEHKIAERTEEEHAANS
jgi:hypothetical protein